MRARHVRLTALSVTLLFVAAAGGAAWFRSRALTEPAIEPHAPTGAPIDGAAAFERHCARCHSVDEFALDARGAERDRQSAAWLELLETHGDASAAEDRAIVESWAETTR